MEKINTTTFDLIVIDMIKFQAHDLSDTDVAEILEMGKKTIKQIFSRYNNSFEGLSAFEIRRRLTSFIDMLISEYKKLKLIPDYEKKKKNYDVVSNLLKRYDEYLAYSKNNINTGIEPSDPYVSILQSSVDYLEHINSPLALVNPSTSLVSDIFETVFKKVTGFLKMLNLGLFPDAFVSWRTLHESECVLKLLVDGDEKCRRDYLTHISYNNAYRNKDNFTQEELDIIFAQIKENMKEHGLKSKDMKKFIEYGWLYSHPKFDPNDACFKLNFRDGVEKLAELSKYSKIYEGASEIAHSSSAFFYVNDEFCKDLSLAMTYQSYVRIAELYLKYMKIYFVMHKEEKERSLFYLEDVKMVSDILKEKIGPIDGLDDE